MLQVLGRKRGNLESKRGSRLPPFMFNELAGEGIIYWRSGGKIVVSMVEINVSTGKIFSRAGVLETLIH